MLWGKTSWISSSEGQGRLRAAAGPPQSNTSSSSAPSHDSHHRNAGIGRGMGTNAPPASPREHLPAVDRPDGGWRRASANEPQQGVTPQHHGQEQAGRKSSRRAPKGRIWLLRHRGRRVCARPRCAGEAGAELPQRRSRALCPPRCAAASCSRVYIPSFRVASGAQRWRFPVDSVAI